MALRVLLTNDDGIHAPGLAALEEVVAEMGEVFVVAPADHQSGCGHQVSTGRPIGVEQLGPQRFAVDGTPADCVRLGLGQLCQDVDWVLSGVNHGGNLGVDVFMSGTVAAAREATLHGVPAVALSQYRRGMVDVTWSHTVQLAQRVLKTILSRPLVPHAFWNANFPDQNEVDPGCEIVECPLEPGNLPIAFEPSDGAYHYRGEYHRRPRQPGSDVDVCFSGNIALTPLRVFPDVHDAP